MLSAKIRITTGTNFIRFINNAPKVKNNGIHEETL